MKVNFRLIFFGLVCACVALPWTVFAVSRMKMLWCSLNHPIWYNFLSQVKFECCRRPLESAATQLVSTILMASNKQIKKRTWPPLYFARKLYEVLNSGQILLSTWMCPEQYKGVVTYTENMNTFLHIVLSRSHALHLYRESIFTWDILVLICARIPVIGELTNDWSM